MAHSSTESMRVPTARGRAMPVGARAIRCGGCARSYEPAAWLALPVEGVLAGEAIAAHVVKWPQGVRIEIRRCAHCGAAIARTVDP
jgi:hypothetical protein